jgi:hypothetical protein
LAVVILPIGSTKLKRTGRLCILLDGYYDLAPNRWTKRKPLKKMMEGFTMGQGKKYDKAFKGHR